MATPLTRLDPSHFAGIRGLILDVDGVLTDGQIHYLADGGELKSFSAQDGSGIKYWHRVGYRSAWCTGRSSGIVERRAAELGVHHLVMAAKVKLPTLPELLARLDLPAKACAYMGDDLVDIPMMRAVGLGITVPNAVQEVKDVAQGVTERPGGHGAVREVVEHILKTQNRWQEILSRYQEADS